MINLATCSYKDVLINHNGEILLYIGLAPYGGHLTILLEFKYGKKAQGLFTRTVEDDDIIEGIND